MYRQLVAFAVLLAVAFAAPPDRERRIVGGVDNVLGQVPWAVSLRTLAGFHFCTGSLVSQWHVVTAAHCVAGRAASTIHLVLGRVTLDGLTGMNRQGFRVTSHPEYHATTMEFDVSVVQVSVIITFSNNVQSIFVSNSQVARVAAKVSGWGATSQNIGDTSNNLRTLDTTTMLNDECQARHTAANAARITPNSLCTDNPVGEGFCQTGSGGSLVWNSQLIGVASWNSPCALGYPDVYVRVSQVRDWIDSVI